MKKVLFVFPSRSIGGSEKSVVESILSLRENFSEFKIYALVPSKGPLYNLLKSLSIDVYAVPYYWWATHKKRSLKEKAKLLKNSFLSIYKLVRFLKIHKFNLVVTNTVTIPQPAIASFIANMNHAWYIHEFGKEDHKLSYFLGEKLSFKIMSKVSQVIIVNSKVVYQKVRSILPERKLVTLYYSVSFTSLESKNCRDNNISILVMGRKAPGKRQEDVIKALGLLVKENIFVTLRLVGSENDEYVEYLKELTEVYNLVESVHFVEFSENPFEYYSESDIVVVPSEMEAFGRVTIEGMKAGKTVVVSNTGAGPELVNHLETGLLFKATDYKDLAEKLKIVISDKELRNRIGVNGRKKALEICNERTHALNLMQALDINGR